MTLEPRDHLRGQIVRRAASLVSFAASNTGQPRPPRRIINEMSEAAELLKEAEDMLAPMVGAPRPEEAWRTLCEASMKLEPIEGVSVEVTRCREEACLLIAYVQGKLAG